MQEDKCGGSGARRGEWRRLWRVFGAAARRSPLALPHQVNWARPRAARPGERAVRTRWARCGSTRWARWRRKMERQQGTPCKNANGEDLVLFHAGVSTCRALIGCVPNCTRKTSCCTSVPHFSSLCTKMHPKRKFVHLRCNYLHKIR
jgi:hypothetical protein